MPKMRDVKIPAAIFFLHRQLKGRFAVQIVIADGVNIFCEIAFGNFLRHIHRLTPTPICGNIFDRALAAHGRDRPAQMLAEVHQKDCCTRSNIARQLSPQGNFGLLRRLGFDIAPAIGNPMHMGVDADAGLVVAQGDDQISGLAPDAFELQQLVDLVGNFAVVVER